MPSKWAYEIAMEQRRDVEAMATNLDAARAQGRREGLEEAVKIVATAGRYVYARDKRPRAKQLRALVLLMRYSGHRIQAAVTCPCERLSGDRLFLYAQKSGAPVWTVLPPIAIDALRESPRACEQFWFSYGAQGETDAGHWSRRLKQVFAEAGIVNGHSHRFRHTFAVSLLERGASTPEVATLLGNTPTVVEKHYSAWVKSRQDALEALLRRMHAEDPLAAAPNRKVVSIG